MRTYPAEQQVTAGLKIVAIVQARMSSQRLPGKVLRPIAGKPLLQWVMECVAASQSLDGILLATSSEPSDDAVEQFAEAHGWVCFRGSLNNVAERFLLAAAFADADAVVRISGDSPLLDYKLIDRAIELFRQGSFDLVTNVKQRTFPSGASVEVFSTAILRRAVAGMESEFDREHVTPWFYRSKDVRIAEFKHDPDLSGDTLTVDTPADMEAMEQMLSGLDRPHTEYRVEDAVRLRQRVLQRSPIGMTGKLRVGVIGLGVGARHVRCYEAHPDCEVTTLCDFDPEQLKRVGAEFPGKKLVEDARRVLTDPAIDIVSIATFDDAHFQQVCMGIEHGKHLLVEKPLCLTADHCRQIRRLLARHPDIRLSSNHVLRVSSRFQELKRQILSGEFGDIYYLEGDYQYGRLQKLTSGWRGDIDDYSVVLGGAVHVIDLLLWLTDDEAVEVTAYANKIASQNTAFRYNDLVAALIKLRSGAIAKVTANFGCQRPHYHAVEIYGTKKTFINRPGPAEIYSSTDKGTEPELMDVPYRDYQNTELIGSFIDWIRGRDKPIVSPQDIFRTMATCFAIENAVHSGQPTPVSY